MGSVVTYWSGCSKIRSDQSELVGFIEQLAMRNDARWHRAGELPSARFETATTQHESSLASRPPSIVRFDHELSGRILIGKSMLLVDQLSDSMQQSARLISSPDVWQNDASMAACAISSRGDEQQYTILVPRFRLQGIAFRLYDPRRLYPDEDCMSFAFVQSPDFPELDGQIVHAFSREKCGALHGEWFQKADWALDTPSVYLRYYLEEWFDLLMAWIKIFFVPELEYWRNEVLNRFQEIKSSIDRLIATDGRETAKQAVFEYILESFESEANEWENEIARITEDEE